MPEEMWAELLTRLKKGYDLSKIPSFDEMLQEIIEMEIDYKFLLK